VNQNFHIIYYLHQILIRIKYYLLDKRKNTILNLNSFNKPLTNINTHKINININMNNKIFRHSNKIRLIIIISLLIINLNLYALKN
jgi:hypothetical protein